MSLHVRPAVPLDTPHLVRIVNAAYREGGGRAWTTEADLVAGDRITREKLADLLAAPGSVVLVAEREARIVGCVHVAVSGTDAHLGMLSVDPAVQASGIGRELLSGAEALARGQGASRMVMEVITERAELLAWYVRRGYRRLGRTMPFGDRPGVTLLQGPLTLELLEKDLGPAGTTHLK